MAKDLSLVQKIVFICNGESCLKAGANENTLALRAAIKNNHLDNEIHTVRTKCLGQCKTGPTTFVHPDNVWYKKMNEQLSNKLVTSHLMKNVYLHANVLFAGANTELNLPPVKPSSNNIFKKLFRKFNVVIFFLASVVNVTAQTWS